MENNIEELLTNAKTEENNIQKENNKQKNNSFKIKDITFLAVITVATLLTGGIMPLLTNIPVFGIIQLGVGLQFSIFSVIGLMKVRKLGSLTMMAVFISLILVFMFPPMAFITLGAIIIELFVYVIFKGYKNDWACVFAGTLYMPFTIPFLTIYYKVFYTVTGAEKSAVSMFIGGTNILSMIVMSVLVLLLCFVGSVIGMKLSKELKKAGVLK